jgi:hypothetical protein
MPQWAPHDKNNIHTSRCPIPHTSTTNSPTYNHMNQAQTNHLPTTAQTNSHPLFTHPTPLTDNDTPPNSHTPNSPPTPPPPTPTQNLQAGYTALPLPILQPTEIRVLSHNINTLPTSSPAELGASFDLYRQLNPSIIGLQETNKNWKKYDATVGRVKQCIDRQWPGSKLVTAHCHDTSFRDSNQPGGIAQMILRQLTARVTAHGRDDLG